MIVGSPWRGQGAIGYLIGSGANNSSGGDTYTQFLVDFTTPSTFSGTISGSTLTLTSAATGSMWEGEVLGCNPFSL